MSGNGWWRSADAWPNFISVGGFEFLEPWSFGSLKRFPQDWCLLSCRNKYITSTASHVVGEPLYLWKHWVEHCDQDKISIRWHKVTIAHAYTCTQLLTITYLYTYYMKNMYLLFNRWFYRLHPLCLKPSVETGAFFNARKDEECRRAPIPSRQRTLCPATQPCTSCSGRGRGMRSSNNPCASGIFSRWPWHVW